MSDLNHQQQARYWLRRALNHPQADFHPGQWEAIEALVQHRQKLLVVQRTGWGKSVVYFIATRLLRDRGAGPTLIVSPLLALMRNQIEAAERLGIRALTINSTNREEWATLISTILQNQADAVLISPERLANDEFVRKVLLPVAQRLGLLVIDEAHCISDWGHDFRPDYRRLVNVLQRMPPNMPLLSFYQLFLRRLQILAAKTPATDQELLERLDIGKSQLQEWLKRAMAEGQVKKLNKPVRYQWQPTPPEQNSFFAH